MAGTLIGIDSAFHGDHRYNEQTQMPCHDVHVRLSVRSSLHVGRAVQRTKTKDVCVIEEIILYVVRSGSGPVSNSLIFQSTPK